MSTISIPATVTIDDSYLIPAVWDTSDYIGELVTSMPITTSTPSPVQVYKINIGPVQEGDRISAFGYAEFTDNNATSYAVSVVTGLIISSDSSATAATSNGFELTELKGDNFDKTLIHHHVANEIGFRTITSGDATTLGTGDVYIIYIAWAVSSGAVGGDVIGVDQDYGRMHVERRRIGTVDNTIPTQSGNSGKILSTTGSACQWIAAPSSLPAQTGNSGKYLSTDGTSPSWGTVSGSLPSQTGNSGKYLTTNGTAASWGTVAGTSAGVTNGSDAAAGDIGEYIANTLALGSAVSLTTNTQTNITSISLTAGDWDVSALIAFNTGASTVVSVTIGSISATSATLGSVTSGAYCNAAGNVKNTVSPTGTTRISITTTTTVYLVAYSIFTTSTQQAYGSIMARRVR